MQAIEIRPFQGSDESTVVAMWQAVFNYSAPHNDPRAIIQHKLAVQRELFFVAILDGRLVGTVMGGYDGHRGWIYSLAVSSDVRRRGIGTALVNHVEHELTKRGCPKINLQVVGSNGAIVELYTKLGYAIEERISLGKVVRSRRLPDGV